MADPRVPRMLVPVLGGLLIAVSASAQIYLGTSPARPHELEPFVILLGVSGSCLGVDEVEVLPNERLIEVDYFAGGCIGPPDAATFEIPVGPLVHGAWTVRASLAGTLVQEAALYVDLAPLALSFEPSHLTAGEPIQALLTGSGRCPNAGPVSASGTLLSFGYGDACPILPPEPGPFSIAVDLGTLPQGFSWVQAVGALGETLVSKRIRVFSTGSCHPDEEVLCLRGGRFRVEAQWSTGRRSGAGKALPLTEDSGSFWFFAANNVELLVKVLDACESAQPRFWVFASGLTNVEVELTVTDLISGEIWSRQHPAGSPFSPILDTTAFATCEQ